MVPGSNPGGPTIAILFSTIVKTDKLSNIFILIVKSIAEYQKEILDKMTKTERKIIIYYLEHGGKAKEIASALNVSERTVYKALYLFRKKLKEKGINPSELYLRSSIEQKNAKAIVAPSSYEKNLEEIINKKILPIILNQVRNVLREELKKILYKEEKNTEKEIIAQGDLVNAISVLNNSIRELNENIVSLISFLNKKDNTHTNMKDIKIVARETLPSFVRGNPWVEVLKSRSTINSKY